MRTKLHPVFLAFAAAVIPAFACHDDDSAPPVVLKSASAVAEIKLDPFQVRVLDSQGREVLRTLTGSDAQGYGGPAATHDNAQDAVRGLPGWDGYSADEDPWSSTTKATVTTKSDTEATFALGPMALTVTLDGAKVKLHLETHDPTANKTTIAFALGQDDHFFGLGERFASVDHRGLSLYSWAEEGAVGRGENEPLGPMNPYPNGPSMTYFPVPFFYSSAGFAMHLATTYRTETHFGSERPDGWRIAANTTAFDTVIYVHDDPLASLDDFTRDVGRPMIPTSWVFGPARRSNLGVMVDGVDEYTALRTRKIPTTTIDEDTHFLPMDSQKGREAELQGYIAALHAKGFKVAAYNNPYVAVNKDTSTDDAAYCTQHGLFALNPDGSVATTDFISGELLTVGELDLTKPEAMQWFEDALERTVAFGYDGWMHDFGEYTRRPWKFGDGRNGEAVHNEFPILSAKAVQALVQKHGGDLLVYMRSGYTGSSQYVPAIWGGDPEADFDNTQGLPASLRAGVNLSMSGVATWGSDISGFKCVDDVPHDKEMYLRWAELGAVSPFMLEDNACSNPTTATKQTKWKVWDDDESVQVYGDMSRLHTRLAPYWEVLVRQANATGIPPTRHPFLLHPKEPEAWKIESAYYVGPSLWAAPVVARGATSKDTWLPPGTWIDFDDYTAYTGGAHVTIPAPLGKLPLLVKDGGIVPLYDASIETLAPGTFDGVVGVDQVKDRLDVVVALSRGKDATITLADGTVLTAKRNPTGGVASGLAAGTPDTIATCDAGCVLATSEGSVDRLRVTTPSAPAFDTTEDDVVLHAQGPSARRVRWDVLRIR
jgi:alpha-glucosidase (family GH31 glycosyl hydrolase)